MTALKWDFVFHNVWPHFNLKNAVSLCESWVYVKNVQEDAKKVHMRVSGGEFGEEEVDYKT